MKKPKLVDVGREAGVSAITVSRALRTPEKVSDSLRKKVEAAVTKLGYIPNQSASTLASSRTNSVVVLVPSLSNSVFTEVLKGLDEALRGVRLTIQIGNTGYDSLEEERVLRSFLNPKPAGVVMSGVEQTAGTKKMLSTLDVPVVQIMDLDTDPIANIVGFSHKEAARSAVEHLIESGYRNIGFLGAQMDPRSQKRLAGYRAAVENANLARENSIAVTNKPSDAHLGSLLFGKLLDTFPDCDAVFCNNDDLALGVLFECQRRGVSVPREMGICGFNDLGITSETFPQISSVSTPLYQIGQIAGNIIIGEDIDPGSGTIDLGYELKARESTLKPK